MNDDEDPVSRKRRLAKERQQRYRARQTPQSKAKTRVLDAEALHTSIAASQRHRIEQMSPHELQLHRETNAATERHRVLQMSPN